MYRPSGRFIEDPDSLHHGQLLHWRYDEDTGLIAKDSSGNGYDGTHVNTPTIDVAGKIKTAYDFDRASTERVTTTNAALLAALAGSSTFAFAIWAKASAFIVLPCAFSISEDGTGGGVALYPFNNDGGMGGADGVAVWYNGERIIDYQGGSLPAADDTYHLYGFESISSTSHRLMIDGLEVATDTTSKTIPAGIDNVTSGNYDLTFSEYYDDSLDNPRVWNRPLTNDEWTRLAAAA